MADGQGSNPHDRLFRFAFQDLDIARDEIRAVLPSAVAAQLRLDDLSIEQEHLPEPDLSERFCDVLYRVPAVDGGERFVWLLLEHQSTHHPLMAFRLLEYMVRIWGRLVRSKTGILELPAIIPVVLTHDPLGWSAPTQFQDLVSSPSGLEVHVPSFEYRVDDLTGATPEAVAERSDRAAFRLILWVLQCRGRVSPTEADAWREAFRLLLRDERWRDIAEAVLTYVVRLDDADDPVAFQAARAASSALETVVTSTAEKLIAQGEAAGLAKGEAAGLAKGEAAGLAKGQAEVLRRLLELKFGDLDGETLAKIEAAESEQLLQWAECVLSAKALDDVFAELSSDS